MLVSETAAKLLSDWDSAVYEGVRLDDKALNREAVLWRGRFVHLRVVGVSVTVPVRVNSSTLPKISNNFIAHK